MCDRLGSDVSFKSPTQKTSKTQLQERFPLLYSMNKAKPLNLIYICDRFSWILGNETHFDVPATNSLVLIRRKGFDKLPPLVSESFRATTSADTDLIINSYLASYLTLLYFFLGIIWIEIKIRSTKAKEWGGFWSLNKFHFLFLP